MNINTKRTNFLTVYNQPNFYFNEQYNDIERIWELKY
jgi:hypothetical protein